MKTLGAVYVFKLNTTSMIWEELEDLKDAVIFLDLACECSIFYRQSIPSELGGYIHILGKMGKVIYSYDVKDKTISLSSMSCLEQSPEWECRVRNDHGNIECETPKDDEVDTNNTRNKENFEPHHPDIPFDVLNMIMEFCVGVEYLNFRATCKHCQLATPMIRWSNETPLRGLQTYSLISPWLIVLDKHRDIITLTDPMFGDKYFITTPQELTGDLQICCSRYGWLLLSKCDGPKELFFFNPFTKDIHKLPDAPDHIDSLCFSGPPTSSYCVIVGLSASFPINAFIHIPSFFQHSWTVLQMDFGCATPHSFLFPTVCGVDIYALNQGALHVFLKNVEERSFQNAIVVEAPRGRCYSSAQYFLVKCDQHLLLVVMDVLGEFVEVSKRDVSTREWEKIDSLGQNMIYICGNTCLCMEAKTPEMENKVYFPQIHSKSGKIVLYSLETRMYHTFNGRNIQQGLENLFGTKYHVYSHAWIEPSWS